MDLKEKVLKSLEDDYGWSGVRRLDQMHVELIKDVINILTEPAEQSEPLTNDQILTVFGKYAECIYDRDDYYISGGKFIDAVREIVSSLKPEQTCEHWQSVRPGKWQCNHEVVTAIEELKVSNKKILDGKKNDPKNNMVFGVELVQIDKLEKYFFEQLDKMAFRVPYDGSNKFYDESMIEFGKELFEKLRTKLKSKSLIDLQSGGQNA